MSISSILRRVLILASCLFPLAMVISTAQAQANLSGLSVISGPVNTRVTITGTGFGDAQGNSTVTFNSTLAAPSSWSDISISVYVPAGATTGPVIVNVAGTNSNSIVFTVTPFIASLSLSTGPVQMGFTINGTSFGAQQGTSTVTLGSITLPAINVISWSDSAIKVSVPAGAATGNVVVSTNGQQSNGVSFTVIDSFSCN
jgi:IPT/TIG domain